MSTNVWRTVELDADGQVVGHGPELRREDLRTYDRVWVYTLGGLESMTVRDCSSPRLRADDTTPNLQLVNEKLIGSLELDERGFWISKGVINRAAINKIKLVGEGS